LGSRREGDHWGDPDVDGRIILREIFRKWEGVVGTGRSKLRIGTGGECVEYVCRYTDTLAHKHFNTDSVQNIRLLASP
jgi:hypothetical protein